MRRNKKIAFAGGSTGGHVMPLVSLIQTLKSQSGHFEIDYYWLGENKSMEQTQANKIHGVQFISISSGKLRRQPSFSELLQNIFDLLKFIRGIFQSLYYLSRHKIQLIFSKGGFVSLPVVIAGRLLRIPIFVHESDSKAGISTRIAAKFATKIFTGFPNVLPNGEYIGQILNPALGNSLEHHSSVDYQKSQVLVNCGSLGSASVHNALLDLFTHDPSLLKKFHWTILLGKLNLGFKQKYNKYSEVVIYEFADQKLMGDLYYSCDIGICRGGSTSLVEQQIFGLKQVIIPIPRTHDQLKNAQYFANNYQDIVIDQNQKDWISQVHQTLLSLQDFKKIIGDNKTILKQLNQGKDKIIKSILFTLDPK